MNTQSYIETFPALEALEGLVHGFVLKHPEIDVVTDRETALERLEQHHVEQLRELGVDRGHLATGGQVHGNTIVSLEPTEGPADTSCPETDGLVTATAGQYLGVFVADCGAVYIADPVRRVCALVHSGKKGTELKIATEAIQEMQEIFGSKPQNMIVQLAPCIRPPAYEVDFAAKILSDCEAAGVPANQIHDCGTCTTSDPDRYYSYRKEMGKTGRLFAVIGWRDE
ncbi:MAG: polyphenol oxidase family protein [Verrucomicrobiota bacterium]